MQTHSVVPFSCFHLGKSLKFVNSSFPEFHRVWNPVATSSNHCCLITEASKRHYHYKLLPMCCVCVFNTPQGCTLKEFILLLFGKIISAKFFGQAWIFPHFSTHPQPFFGQYCQPLDPFTVSRSEIHPGLYTHSPFASALLLHIDLTILCLGHFRHKYY